MNLPVSNHPKEDIQIQATVVKLAMQSDGLEINSLLTDLKEKEADKSLWNKATTCNQKTTASW